MGKKVYLDDGAEREATQIGKKFMNSTDVVGDMSRAYGTDLSAVRLHADDGAARQAAERGVDAFSTGEDVFFGWNVFNRNDSASRGLLAHELSHSLQQGTGGMTQSVPAGAAQGGFLDWFRGIFGGGAENAEQENEEPVPEEAVPVNAGRDARQDLLSAADRLAAVGKAGGGSNSDLYNAVIRAVVRVSGVSGGNLETNQVANMKRMDKMEEEYRQLIEACEAYTARTALSIQGRERKGIVMQLLSMAQSDLAGLGEARTDILALPPEELTTTSWGQVLGMARSVRLSVSDYAKLNKESGGQVSDVKMLHDGNTTVHGDTGDIPLERVSFFKEEDSMNVKSKVGKRTAFSYSVALDETLEKFPGLKENDQRLLEQYVEKKQQYIRRGLETVTEQLSPAGKEAYAYLTQRGAALQTQVDEVVAPMGLVETDGNINTTRRNVATSRIANLLGLGHLVAKSRTAEIYDQKTKKTIRGNLMDGAPGMKNDDMRKQYKARHAAGDISGFTGGFQRDLVSLQVLDVLCGQVDRHENNLMYQMDDQGNLIGLQAFDNDASFGLNLDVAHTEHNQRHDRRVYDPNSGDLVIPYMDRALAERILALDADVLRLALRDLLREVEIEAAVKRLDLMQTAIKRAEQEPQTGEATKRFLTDEDWGIETAEAMMNLSQQLVAAGKEKEFTDQINKQRDIDERDIRIALLKQAGAEDGERALKELEARRGAKTQTPEDDAIWEYGSFLAVQINQRVKIKKTTANDTYFGRYFKGFR